jgi:hypothetical protein
MQIISNPLSLFSYIGDNNNKADNVLKELAKSNNKDVGGGLDVLETGLNRGAFEETLQLMDKGEIDIDLNLV